MKRKITIAARMQQAASKLIEHSTYNIADNLRAMPKHVKTKFRLRFDNRME